MTGIPTHLSSCSFGASLSADPPDQTEQLLPHTVTLNLPALNNMQKKKEIIINTTHRLPI